MAERKPWDDPVLEPDDVKKLRKRTKKLKEGKRSRKADSRPVPLGNVAPPKPGSEAIALARKLKKRNQGIAAGTGRLPDDKTLLKKDKNRKGAF